MPDTHTDSQRAELLPCPFCGASSSAPTRFDQGHDAVFCHGCEAEGPATLGKDKAVAAWNRRAQSKSSAGAVAQVTIAVPHLRSIHVALLGDVVPPVGADLYLHPAAPADTAAPRWHVPDEITREEREAIRDAAQAAHIRHQERVDPGQLRAKAELLALVEQARAAAPSSPFAPFPGMDKPWPQEEKDRLVAVMGEAFPTTPADAGAGAEGVSQAALDVLAERRRQVEVEGYTHDRDDTSGGKGDLGAAGACYALYGGEYWPGNAPDAFPWVSKKWKPSGFRDNFVKAAALILAEVERIDRKAALASARATLPAAAPAEPGGYPDLPEKLRADALEIFDGPECPQSVRDAIEWCAATLRVEMDRAQRLQPGVAVHMGPQGGAPKRFAEWIAGEDFTGMESREIASLGFDAGHAFWHEAADGWRPIDSAPTDGTVVWAWNGAQGEMKWLDHPEYHGWIWADEDDADGDPKPAQPTHWRWPFLPPATSARSQAGEKGAGHG